MGKSIGRVVATARPNGMDAVDVDTYVTGKEEGYQRHVQISIYPGYAQLTKDEALKLAKLLIEAALDC